MPHRRWIGLCLVIATTAALPASAHFILQSPASWREQNVLGDPQKTGPCGDEGTAALTGAVTAFSPGETITISIDEVIFHPGHYRVALAVNDRSELPAEPPVTPGATDCGSVPIMSPAEFPVLADGMLLHTEPFPDAQSFQVTLPSDVTCTHCTLQVLEFMSNHGAPCFYHHCADISIGEVTSGCASDAECNDGDGCTTDRCSVDGACVATPIAFEDLLVDIAGVFAEPACALDTIPPGVFRLVGKVGVLAGRVLTAPTPRKARRSFVRAAKKLGRAARKVGKITGRRLGESCGEALGVRLETAAARFECFDGSLPSPPPLD